MGASLRRVARVAAPQDGTEPKESDDLENGDELRLGDRLRGTLGDVAIDSVRAVRDVRERE